MNQITRRNLLKGLAAAPLVSALSPLENVVSQTRRPTPELCLWFHGLFAFVVKNDYIAVLTPKVEDHQFLAGLWKQEQKLKEGEWYRLSGVSDTARPNPWPAVSKERMLFLSGVKGINMADSYCLIRLPFPRQIIPLRYAKATFTGDDAAKVSGSTTFPTVQLMRYRVVDYSNLRLEPFKAWVKQKRPPSIIHFHIFAEPDFMVHPEHAMRAFDGMIQMFSGVDLKLKDTSERCFPLDTNLSAGIDPKQQISLAERNGACDKPTGGRTGNCFMIIIDDRTPTP
jgi:hypothetical protein